MLIMTNKLKSVVPIAIIVTLSSCAKICTVQTTNVDINGKQISFGSSKFPCKKVSDYEIAVTKAITSIFSYEFERKLTEYIKDSIVSGEHVKAWEGLETKEIVRKMRDQINGEYVETYGGLNGWFKNKFFGNLAYDGTMNGPIRINRIPLKFHWRDAASIANTIAHETAHRIGLTHPNSDTDLRIAYKEPPYIIGEIIEKIARQQISN
jgi:hypothetical protein